MTPPRSNLATGHHAAPVEWLGPQHAAASPSRHEQVRAVSRREQDALNLRRLPEPPRVPSDQTHLLALDAQREVPSTARIYQTLPLPLPRPSLKHWSGLAVDQHQAPFATHHLFHGRGGEDPPGGVQTDVGDDQDRSLLTGRGSMSSTMIAP